MSGLSLSAWAHTTPHEFQTKSCHSTQRKITLLFNNVGPHSASQVSFFNYVRSQRIRRTRLSHKPTQRIKIFLLESREPAQRITITIFCCLHRAQQFSSSITWAHTAHHDCFFSVTHPGQNNSPLSNTWAHTAHHDYFFFCYPPITHSFVAHTGQNDPLLPNTWAHTVHHDLFSFVTHPGHNNSPLSITWAHTGHHDYHFFFAHQAHKDSPLSITWALTVHHDYNYFVTHTRHNDSPLSHTCIHPALHHPFLLLPLQDMAILHFQSSAHTVHHGYSCFVESRSPTQGITVLFFKAREPI